MWWALQVAALALAASHVRLHASYPTPPEQVAPLMMTLVQLAGLALLFPLLLSNVATMLAVAAMAAVFQQLAGWLAIAAPHDLWAPTGFVAAWAVALYLLRAAFLGDDAPSARQHYATAALGCWNLGGIALWYLQLEFRGSELPTWVMGPLSSVAGGGIGGLVDWLSPFTICLLSVGWMLVGARKSTWRQASAQSS